jgi:sugar lactone lactonase YvrE
MSLDARLRNGLERSARGIEERELDAALLDVVKGARRRRLVRRVVATGVVLAGVLAAIVFGPKAFDALRSEQHRRIPVAPKGSGVITTVVGNGRSGSSGDGGPAVRAKLNYPVDLGFDADGNLYVLDLGNPSNPGRVRKVDLSRRITTVVGGGAPGEAGGAILGTTFGATGLAVDAEGNVFVAGGDGSSTDHTVIRVDPSGDVRRVVGTGEPGHSGDGGLATAATLGVPFDVAVDASGNLYIGDGNRIRKVDTSGIIHTIAGTGEAGFSGDGGPATAARIDHVSGIAVDDAGNVYFIDQGNARVRRIDASGSITTIAGNGKDGYSGDGGSATDARINEAEHLWVDAGAVYIADTYNRRIRRVGGDGIITTVAGSGNQRFAGDGGPGTLAGLSNCSGVAIGPDGNLYIADSVHNRVRMVDL